MLSHEQIDQIAAALPGGVTAYCKEWGYNTLARAIEAEVRKQVATECLRICLRKQGDSTEDLTQWDCADFIAAEFELDQE